jgi:hypothetical protein
MKRRDDRVGESRRITGRYEDARALVGDDVRDAADARGHDGTSARE